eukprot:gene15309-18138_t
MTGWFDVQRRIHTINEQMTNQKDDINLIKLSVYYVNKKDKDTKNLEALKQSIIKYESDYQQLADEECKLNDKINMYIENRFESKRNEISNPFILEELKDAYLSIIDPLKRTQYINNSFDFDDNISGSGDSNSSSSGGGDGGTTLSSHESNNSKYMLNDNSTISPQSPLFFYSLLNIPSKSLMFTQSVNANKKTSFAKETKSLQLLLKWSCVSQVQEYCLEMRTQQVPTFTVIYRGHNNYYTTPSLELGDYHFKVKATNRFGVGAYTVYSHTIGTSNNSGSIISGRIMAEEQRLKKREEVVNEVTLFLNTHTGTSTTKSMAQYEELSKHMTEYKTKLLSYADITTEATKLTLERLERLLVEIGSILASNRVLCEWKMTIKKSMSDYLNSTKQNDNNEQLDVLVAAVASLTSDLPDQIKTMVYQTVIQATKKKVFNDP